MKLKTWHLFAIIVILFVCSFYVINLKFDKFYRLNGINNDNRVIIEKYLDKSEQTYLIDNQIQIILFIDYIQEEDFILQNYQYYNSLKDTNRYKNNSEIISVGNSISSRLTYLYNNDAFSYAKELIENNLEMAFLNNANFNMDYVNLYKYMRPLYNANDYSFVEDTDSYILRLNELGIKKAEDLDTAFSQMTVAYNQETLSQLMSETVDTHTKVILNPHELTTVVNENNYIGHYSPSGLLLVQDIPRVRYTIYLQNDAYNALLKMYQDLNKECDGFILKEGYMSPSSLSDEEVGYNEFQLGLSIEVIKSQTAYDDFANTDMSQWLEEHAYEYGYILRYPKNKASITNHAYNPHIYRYVGKSLAKSLHEADLTLEEYLDLEE